MKENVCGISLYYTITTAFKSHICESEREIQSAGLALAKLNYWRKEENEREEEMTSVSSLTKLLLLGAQA